MLTENLFEGKAGAGARGSFRISFGGCLPFAAAFESAMGSHKSVFTTGEVARICNVSPRTVSKWFDSGQLRGFRIPGSKDRRIPLNQLLRFMRAHGIPVDNLETGTKRILVLDSDTELGNALKRSLSANGTYEVSVADSAFEAGAIAVKFLPHVVLVDVDMGDVEPRAVSRFVRSNPELSTACLIATAKDLARPRGETLLQAGFDAYLSKPFETRTLLLLFDEKFALPRSAPRDYDPSL